MACVVRNCNEHTSKKALMCKKHWYALPANVRADVRRGTEKGGHSLRAIPTREWLSQASKTVGDVKYLNVRVDVDSKVKKSFQKNKPQEAAA